MFRCHERSAGQVYFYPYNQNKIEIQGHGAGNQQTT